MLFAIFESCKGVVGSKLETDFFSTSVGYQLIRQKSNLIFSTVKSVL